MCFQYFKLFDQVVKCLKLASIWISNLSAAKDQSNYMCSLHNLLKIFLVSGFMKMGMDVLPRSPWLSAVTLIVIVL